MKDIRPTSGKVLLALFSILGSFDGDTKFLDLFSGTGNVGLEAMNRGANSCVFVESVKSRAESIRRNLQNANENVIVLSLEVRRAVSWLVKRERKFNIIFADPPYNSGWCEVLPGLNNLAKLFDDNCVFVMEHSTRENLKLKDNPNELEITSQKIYGETCLTFMKRKI